MDRRLLLRDALRAGLLVTAHPGGAFAAESATAEPFADFFALPIYRCYVRGLQHRDLPEGWPAALAVPQSLDLLKEPDNEFDRRAVAVYADGIKVGYLPREDNLILEKLIRRGLPVTCRLVGVQPAEETYRSLSVEVSLLYPRHPTTDGGIQGAERDRREGLRSVSRRPLQHLRSTGDPLSAGHVYDGYYEEGLSES